MAVNQDKMMTTAESPSTPGPSSLHTQVRSCNLCRQRRVKCDRQLPRCSSCLRSEANCVYPPGRGRAPKRPRNGVAPLLSERLSRLETIINQFGPAAQESHLAREVTNTREASLDQDFSRLKVDESKSYYVNNALWVTLSNEVEELRAFLFEPASEDGYEPASSPHPQHSKFTTTSTMVPSLQLGLNASIFGYRAIASTLQNFHPSLRQAVALFAAFTENVAPLVHIFHMPTLTRVYWDAIASLDYLDKHTETLLFAIHYSAVISLTPEQCLSTLDETREVALEKYRFAVEQAFARGDLLNTQNIRMVQAAVLFLSALPNEDDSRATWSLTSLIYHIARTMGLHRDGTVFGLKPFETELRRRLWWQICIIDSRSSEYHCNEPIARGFASDTKPPLHINDTDLWPEMVDPLVERWDHATDMTLSLIRCDAIQTGWKLGLIKQKQPSRADGNNVARAEDSLEPSEKRRALVKGLESRIRDKYLPICDCSVPFQLLSAAVARIIIARFWLITQYSIASREKKAGHENNNSHISTGTPENAGQLDDSTRDKLFKTSIEILEVSGMLVTKKEIMKWTWHSKTHIQWGAMAFVLSELCARPYSSECDRAWDCVTKLYDGWKIGGNQDDEGRLALWRPIRRLMAKARYLREMQRTDPRLPAQVNRRTQCSDPAPRASDVEFLSHHPQMSPTNNWYTSSPQTMSSVPTPDCSLSCLSSVPYSKEPSNVLQGVLGTETLAPFMDYLPEWPWIEDDGDTTFEFSNFDSGLPQSTL